MIAALARIAIAITVGVGVGLILSALHVDAFLAGGVSLAVALVLAGFFERHFDRPRQEP